MHSKPQLRAYFLGRRASICSLIPPILAMVVGFFIRAASAPRTILVLVSLNIGIIAVGLGLALAALWLLPREARASRKNAWLGLSLNSLYVLTFVVMFCMPFVRNYRYRSLLVGNWQGHLSEDNKVVMDLRFDRDGGFASTTTLGKKNILQADARWKLTFSARLEIDIQHQTPPVKSEADSRSDLGRIKSLDDHQLIFSTDRGDESFARQ